MHKENRTNFSYAVLVRIVASGPLVRVLVTPAPGRCERISMPAENITEAGPARLGSLLTSSVSGLLAMAAHATGWSNQNGVAA